MNAENEHIVKRQIEAYNNHDIEECLSYWSDDLKAIRLSSGEVGLNSKAEVRLHLVKSFKDYPNLNIELLSIASAGDFVTTIEKKEMDGKTYESIYIYHLANGVIAKMWLAK